MCRLDSRVRCFLSDHSGFWIRWYQMFWGSHSTIPDAWPEFHQWWISSGWQTFKRQSLKDPDCPADVIKRPCFVCSTILAFPTRTLIPICFAGFLNTTMKIQHPDKQRLTLLEFGSIACQCGKLERPTHSKKLPYLPILPTLHNSSQSLVSKSPFSGCSYL